MGVSEKVAEHEIVNNGFKNTVLIVLRRVGFQWKSGPLMIQRDIVWVLRMQFELARREENVKMLPGKRKKLEREHS